jgi:hypothetical protein
MGVAIGSQRKPRHSQYGGSVPRKAFEGKEEMTQSALWQYHWRRFIATLPYSALLYVASAEEDQGNHAKASIVYDEISERDTGGKVQKPVPEGMGGEGDWRE